MYKKLDKNMPYWGHLSSEQKLVGSHQGKACLNEVEKTLLRFSVETQVLPFMYLSQTTKYWDRIM